MKGTPLSLDAALGQDLNISEARGFLNAYPSAIYICICIHVNKQSRVFITMRVGVVDKWNTQWSGHILFLVAASSQPFGRHGLGIRTSLSRATD